MKWQSLFLVLVFGCAAVQPNAQTIAPGLTTREEALQLIRNYKTECRFNEVGAVHTLYPNRLLPYGELQVVLSKSIFGSYRLALDGQFNFLYNQICTFAQGDYPAHKDEYDKVILALRILGAGFAPAGPNIIDISRIWRLQIAVTAPLKSVAAKRTASPPLPKPKPSYRQRKRHHTELHARLVIPPALLIQSPNSNAQPTKTSPTNQHDTDPKISVTQPQKDVPPHEAQLPRPMPTSELLRPINWKVTCNKMWQGSAEAESFTLVGPFMKPPELPIVEILVTINPVDRSLFINRTKTLKLLDFAKQYGRAFCRNEHIADRAGPVPDTYIVRIVSSNGKGSAAAFEGQESSGQKRRIKNWFVRHNTLGNAWLQERAQLRTSENTRRQDVQLRHLAKVSPTSQQHKFNHISPPRLNIEALISIAAMAAAILLIVVILIFVLRAYGLYTHIRSNMIKSAVLIAGFPFVLPLIYFSIVFSGLALLGNSNAFVVASNSAIALFIIVIAITAVWLPIGYLINQWIIDRATGAHQMSRAENPRVWNLLENLCISRGMTMPALRIVESDELNAFASGIRNGSYSITVTRGLIDELEDDELEGVLAHELTHIRNHDVQLLIISIILVGIVPIVHNVIMRLYWLLITFLLNTYRTIFTLFSMPGLKAFVTLTYNLLFLAGKTFAYIIGAIGYFCSLIINFALSRRREFLADAGAIELTKNPDALISALRKVQENSDLPTTVDGVRHMFFDNPRLMGIEGLFSTHPSIEKRIEAIVRYGRDVAKHPKSHLERSPYERRVSDYFLILSNQVETIDPRASGERAKLYDHVRMILNDHLSSAKRSDAHAQFERQALEAAIHRVEMTISKTNDYGDYRLHK